MLDRLTLSPNRLEAIAHDVLAVSALPDPVGEVFDMRTLPNGLMIGRKRVPLGVIGAIYESRPNVTVDISVLCLKSGNAVILRGGKEATHSNSALASVVQEAATRASVPEGTVQFIENTDRSLVDEMLSKRKTESEDYRPSTFESAIKYMPDANLVLISLPGKYAAREVKKALLDDKNVMLFSDNVLIEEEVELKKLPDREVF